MTTKPIQTLLAELIAIDSVNPELEAGGAGEAAMAQHCAEFLRASGFDVDVIEVAPGRPNVIARHGTGSPTLLFNGHLDTVGVAGMSVPPLEPRVSDGRMFGRGSCDMKGGLAALLEAGRRLADSGHDGTLMIALTCDEEHASIGMAHLVESGIQADAAVVCEPTELAVMPAHKGFVWMEARFRGRAAHGSRPDEGVDAVRHAAVFLASLDELESGLNSQPPHPLLGHGSLHVGTISGGSAASVYPDSCTVVLERRTLPGESNAQVVEEFAQQIKDVATRVPGLDATLTCTLARPGTEVDRSHRLVEGLCRALNAQGIPDRIEGMTAWVDAAYLNESGIPAVCFGPGSIARAHTADESVELDQVVSCAEVLEHFGREFLTP